MADNDGQWERGLIERLTARERDVLLGLVEGHTNKVIGESLDISQSPRRLIVASAAMFSDDAGQSHAPAGVVAGGVGGDRGGGIQAGRIDGQHQDGGAIIGITGGGQGDALVTEHDPGFVVSGNIFDDEA